MEIFVLQPWKRRHFCKVPATKIFSKSALAKSTVARLNVQKNSKSTKLPPDYQDFPAFPEMVGESRPFSKHAKMLVDFKSIFCIFPTKTASGVRKNHYFFNISPNGQNKIGLTSRRLWWEKMCECQTFQKQPCFQIYDQGVVKIDQSKVVHFLTN